ncbi:hypothetical protein E2C01_001119 [Portunus trituberculatus]|uniref:Uncharacterized protein n=1 Tax=Portunus trituberculatus TaxID=210409 RepID=A0A5B7CFX0_PORTR|nr:hypothetical protein [Portunus trituberculatus]
MRRGLRPRNPHVSTHLTRAAASATRITHRRVRVGVVVLSGIDVVMGTNEGHSPTCSLAWESGRAAVTNLGPAWLLVTGVYTREGHFLNQATPSSSLYSPHSSYSANTPSAHSC